jgi:hypothetical protein
MTTIGLVSGHQFHVAESVDSLAKRIDGKATIRVQCDGKRLLIPVPAIAYLLEA